MYNITKHQHYVWQHYLRAWTVKSKLFCYRQAEKKLFNPTTKSIAGETFFYRAQRLTEQDIAYVNMIIDKVKMEMIRNVHRHTLKMFQMSFKIRDRMTNLKLSDLRRAEMEEVLTEIEKTIGEKFNGIIEQHMIEILELLKQGDTSFYNDNDKLLRFLNFLTHQFFRTPKLKLINQSIESSVEGLDLKRTWLIESNIYAVNVASGLFNERNEYKIVLLENKSNIPFITSDNPVINLKTMHDKDMKLYYPLTPKLALILTNDKEDFPISNLSIGSLSVEHYNQQIYSKSVDQLYCSDRSYLENLVKYPKTIN